MSQNESNRDTKVISSCVAICIIFFVFIICRLLKQIFWPSHREVPRQPRHRANFEDPPTQFDSRGLEVSILRSLPVFQYAKKVVDEEKQPTRPSSNECAICLGEFEEGDWLKLLPGCKHVFHIPCIDAWFQGHTNCPLCRSPVNVHNHLSVCIESPRLSHSSLETLRREDSCRERATHYQIVRSEILQNLGIRSDQTVFGPVPSH